MTNEFDSFKKSNESFLSVDKGKNTMVELIIKKQPLKVVFWLLSLLTLFQ
jgi:hypothetical protein